MAASHAARFMLMPMPYCMMAELKTNMYEST